MDLFPDGIHVRLRSRARGGYLYADEDGVGVSLSPRRASLNAAWRVHVVERGDIEYVLLHGAAYGRYLALSPDPAPPPGHRGRRAVQRDYDEQDLHAVMWRADRAGDGGGDDVVVLRHRGFVRILRANGRYRRWRTAVTVDYDVDNYGEWGTMMHWAVEEIPPRPAPPAPPFPTANLGGSGIISLFRRRAELSSEPLQTIRFVRMTGDGHFNQHGWVTFQFYGRSLYLLLCRVVYHLDEPIFVGDEGNLFGITLCVRAGVHGYLTPLVIDLPRCEEPMDIFVLTTGSPAALELRHPDIDA